VTVENNIREEAARKFEEEDYEAHKDERQAEEEQRLRLAEMAAAEKQIIRTSERLAREYVAAVTLELEQQELIAMMDRTYVARRIRSLSWTLAAASVGGMIVANKIIDSTRTDLNSLDMNSVYVMVFGSMFCVTMTFVGWKWGIPKRKIITEEETKERIEAKKAELLIEFHEKDRRRRAAIEIQDQREEAERRGRIQARKAEKKRLKKMARRREKKALASRLEREASRRLLLGKDQTEEQNESDVDKAKSALAKFGQSKSGMSMLDAAKLAKEEAVDDEEKEELFGGDDQKMDKMEQGIESLLDDIEKLAQSTDANDSEKILPPLDQEDDNNPALDHEDNFPPIGEGGLSPNGGNVPRKTYLGYECNRCKGKKVDHETIETEDKIIMRHTCDDCGFVEETERPKTKQLKKRNPTQFHGGAAPLPGIKYRKRPESREEEAKREYEEERRLEKERLGLAGKILPERLAYDVLKKADDITQTASGTVEVATKSTKVLLGATKAVTGGVLDKTVTVVKTVAKTAVVAGEVVVDINDDFIKPAGISREQRMEKMKRRQERKERDERAEEEKKKKKLLDKSNKIWKKAEEAYQEHGGELGEV